MIVTLTTDKLRAAMMDREIETLEGRLNPGLPVSCQKLTLYELTLMNTLVAMGRFDTETIAKAVEVYGTVSRTLFKLACEYTIKQNGGVGERPTIRDDDDETE